MNADDSVRLETLAKEGIASCDRGESHFDLWAGNDEQVKLFGRTFQNVCEVTEYQPTRRFAFKSTSETPFRYVGAFSFEANGRGTKLTLSVESALKGLWRIFEPIARMEMKNGIEGELKTLKSILETSS